MTEAWSVPCCAPALSASCCPSSLLGLCLGEEDLWFPCSYHTASFMLVVSSHHLFFICKIRALLLLASFPSAAAAAHQAPMCSCNRTWKTSFPLAVNTLSSKEISNWVMDGLLACQRALFCKIANIWKVIPGKYFYISMAGQIQPFQAFRHTLSSCSTWPRPEGWFWQAHKDFLGNLGIASSFISASSFLPPPRPSVSA